MSLLTPLAPVQRTDWQELIDFYDRVTEATLGKKHNPGWAKGEWPKEDFLQDLINKGRIFKACIDDKIAGTLAADHNTTPGYEDVPWLVDAAPNEVTVFHVVAVDPALQRSGIAKRVVQMGLDLAREECQKSVRLDVYPINLSGRRLYEACGFHYHGQHPLYYDGFDVIHSHIYEFPLA